MSLSPKTQQNFRIGVVIMMKRFCGIKSFCTILLLLCFLFVVTSCALFERAGTGSDEEGSSSPASSPAGASAPEVIIPMDNVPDECYHADKSRLKLVEDKVEMPGFPNDTYEDGNGIQYEFDKITEDYRGFTPPVFNHDRSVGADYIEMERLEEAADEIASHFIQVEEYERTYFYQEDTAIHKFTYYKEIEGYPSTDKGNVWITSDGYVELVSFMNTGIFDDIDIPVIDGKALDDIFYQSLGEEEVCSEIYERTLTLKDKELYMYYFYSATVGQDNPVTYGEEKYIKIP